MDRIKKAALTAIGWAFSLLIVAVLVGLSAWAFALAEAAWALEPLYCSLAMVAILLIWAYDKWSDRK